MAARPGAREGAAARALASGVASALSARRTNRTSARVILRSCTGAAHAERAGMCELSSLDRCAAYVAAHSARIAVDEAAHRWPTGLAVPARRAAAEAVLVIREAVSYAPASAGRRRCLRDAISRAVHVAAAIDAARTMGFDDPDLDDAQRVTSRAIALLGMFLHASTTVVADGE
ncbi:MAG TPA: hypothetical protein VFK02_33780 [Kofleriaceae bacterium]|nr:hypothetical protein [Kofleriaceae bacterium]